MATKVRAQFNPTQSSRARRSQQPPLHAALAAGPARRQTGPQLLQPLLPETPSGAQPLLTPPCGPVIPARILAIAAVDVAHFGCQASMVTTPLADGWFAYSYTWLAHHAGPQVLAACGDLLERHERQRDSRCRRSAR